MFSVCSLYINVESTKLMINKLFELFLSQLKLYSFIKGQYRVHLILGSKYLMTIHVKNHASEYIQFTNNLMSLKNLWPDNFGIIHIFSKSLGIISGTTFLLHMHFPLLYNIIFLLLPLEILIKIHGGLSGRKFAEETI